MRQGHKAHRERVEVDAAGERDLVDLDLPRQSFRLELFLDQPGGEGRGVKRHLQFVGEIGNGADMILVTMGQDDADQFLLPLFDEFEIGKDQIDARIIGIRKGEAEIDHQPFAPTTIEIDVHADLARAAQGQE